MAFTYTTVDGKRVNTAVARSYFALEAAFRAQFGLDLIVSDGVRSYAEQKRLYNDYISGRSKIRAANPDSVQAYHVETNPTGPRALDIRDSGGTPGVTSYGNARSAWIRDNARRFNFNPRGYHEFNEPWHIEFLGTLDSDGVVGSPAGGSAEIGSAAVKSIQGWLNTARGEKLVVDGISGPATVAAVRRYQEFLRGYGYTGAIDGDWGPGTQSAHEKFFAAFNTPQPGSTQIVVDGQWGEATTRALQVALGVSVDGQMGPQTISALQAKLGATVDGQMGPDTARALQRFLNVETDGAIGPQTVAALQNYLNTGKRFDATPNNTPSTPVPAAEKLVEDGQWGPATTKALQRYFKVTEDGELGPITIKALQSALGQAVDGQMGPKTIKALQTNVGVSADGQLGPITVTALQKFLNNGGVFQAVIVEDTAVVTYPKPAAPQYSGATWWHHSPNSSPRRDGDRVQYFVVHHAADPRSVEVQRDRFMAPNDRNVSCNWLIGKDGSISEIVPPDKFRAWTTGKFDYNAVTVETQNSSGSPTWGITEESHVAIAKLVAWASKRYGFPINRQHVLGHREVPNVPATACPGPNMNVDRIVELAIGFANPELPGFPEPETPKEPELPEQPEVPEIPEVPTEPKEDLVTITLPKEEADELKKLLKEAIALLTKLTELLP